ncbi:MAG: hypothetical protein QGG14_10895, partial [Planctomycetota bacterium]|nr:hypothetical protein [Planctomycetota bacterium]
ASSLMSREMLGDLVAQAADVGRFAARWSSEWMTSGHGRPSPIGEAARKRLGDTDSKAATVLRARIDALRSAEQAVIDARDASDFMYEARCRERDAALRVAEEAAQAAPASAVALFDEALKREHAPVAGADETPTAGDRCFTVALNKLVQPLLNRAENEVAAELLCARTVALQRQLDAFEETVEPHRAALTRLSPDGGRRVGRWCRTSWCEVLIAVVRDLLAAVEGVETARLASLIEALEDEHLLIGVLNELAKVGPGSNDTQAPSAGDLDVGFGPELTFRAVCDVVLAQKKASGAAPTVVAGDSAARAAVMTKVRAGGLQELRADKASQYLTPKGRLCEVGWINRNHDRVVVTEAGAQAWARAQST